MATIRRDPFVVSRPPQAYPLNLRTWVVAGSLTLLVASVPAPNVAKPAATALAPAGRDFPVTLRTWTQNLLQRTLFVAPATPPPGRRSPDAPPPIGAPYPTDLRTLTQNLQERGLFVAPAPVQATLSDLPAGKPYPSDLRTWTRPPSLALTVAAVTLPTGHAPDPAPSAAIYPLNLRTLQTVNPSPLNGTPQAYLTRIPNVAPQPLRPWPVTLRTWTQNLQQTTLAQPSTVPFNQYNWPTPRGAQVYPVNLRTHIYFYVTDDNVPPQASDITSQVPRARDFPSALRTHIASSLPILISVRAPYQERNWPTIPGAPYPSPLRTQTTSLLQTTLAPTIEVPAGATHTELPRPAGYPSELRTTALDLQQTTLAPPAAAPPPVLSAFELPQPTVYPSELRTWVAPLSRSLSEPLPPVAVSTDLPRGDGYPTDLRTVMNPAPGLPLTQPAAVSTTRFRRTYFGKAGTRRRGQT